LARGRLAWLRDLAAWSSLLLVGCTSSSDCPSGSSPNFVGAGCISNEPVAACRSWTTFMALASPVSPIDRTVSPAQGDLRVGSQLRTGVVVVARDPQYCGGPIDRPAGWRTSDPAILRIESTAGASATLVGGAPGTAQVFAEMPKPGGGTRAVELSVCVDPGAAPNDDSCPRIPLTIRVVP
jgi:hypothetical protein